MHLTFPLSHACIHLPPSLPLPIHPFIHSLALSITCHALHYEGCCPHITSTIKWFHFTDVDTEAAGEEACPKSHCELQKWDLILKLGCCFNRQNTSSLRVSLRSHALGTPFTLATGPHLSQQNLKIQIKGNNCTVQTYSWVTTYKKAEAVSVFKAQLWVPLHTALRHGSHSTLVLTMCAPHHLFQA